MGDLERTDFGIYTFNLVIRLSKVKQSALSFEFQRVGRGVEQLAAVPGITIFWRFAGLADRCRPPFCRPQLQLLQTFRNTCKAIGMSFSCRYGLFGFW